MRRNLLLSAAAIWLVPVVLSAGQFPWSRSRTVEFQKFEAPGRRFAMEYPKKEWHVVPGAGSVLFVFTQSKAEASVTIDHTVLRQALAPSEITQLFADLEVEEVKERQPSAQGFKTALRTETDGRRVIVIDFTRPGLKGSERVRQYSLPIDADLYRLTCTSPIAQFAKYEDVFERMAMTFAVAAPASQAASER